MPAITKSGNVLTKKLTKIEQTNSISYEYVINEMTLLNKLKTVDGEGSGLDADLFESKEGSYYTNASNLDSGTVPVERLSGTYNIDISGNAATATNADKVDNFDASQTPQPNVIPVTGENGKLASEFVDDLSSIINAIIFG